MTQLLPVAPLHQFSMGKWKDLIIGGGPVWVTAAQKAISYLKQLFSPVKVEEVGGEIFLNVCVSFRGTFVLDFTSSIINSLGAQSVSHSLKTSQLSHIIYGLLRASLLPNISYEIEWLYLFKAMVFFLSPKFTSISYYLIEPITIYLTNNIFACSEFHFW